VNKSKIRSIIIKLRKRNHNKNLKIDPKNVISFLKNNNYHSKNFGGYYPSNYEIDDLEILYLLEKKGYNISLPIIKKNNQMDFFQWSKNEPLKINKYGIPEPISKKITYPDILFVPLVGFDNKLNRLGYGGGFYDRYIDKIERNKNIIIIGLAFSYQKLKKIPINFHDKRLNFVITEKEIV
tara:strand:- start:169 stop:711 length:543 start_codon:yes stop_codon:yes gene_type:complete